MKHFKSSIIFTIFAIIITFFLGIGKTMDIPMGLQSIFIVIVLGILEVSLSFDNAVVNASVLKKMDSKWQHRFLTRGMAIAVFGMRIFFPLMIVAIVGAITPRKALQLAIYNPEMYASILTSSHTIIAGFGGTFLMMVAFNFFLDAEKHNHWIYPIEKFLQKIGKLESIGIIGVLIVLLLSSKFLHRSEVSGFIISGIRGSIVYVIVNGAAKLLESKRTIMENISKAGISLFIYLEILDASFSFDGVIGAFVLSKNIFIIALGLGIGAMFVRSLTLMLVKKGTLTKYAYLEHGAFWAIFALASIMFINTIYKIPEIFTGIIGALIIGGAIFSSIQHNKKNKE